MCFYPEEAKKNKLKRQQVKQSRRCEGYVGVECKITEQRHLTTVVIIISSEDLTLEVRTRVLESTRICKMLTENINI